MLEGPPMVLFSWLKSIPYRSTATRRRSVKPSRQRFVEQLEQREVLTTFVVNSLIDAVDANPGDGVALTAGGVTTLRAAVQEANALAGADVIQIPIGTVQLNIMSAGEDGAASGDLDLTEDVTITGISSTSTILDFDDLDRVFDVAAGVTATISQLLITDATSNSVESGGAVRNAGTLTLDHVDLRSNNTASGGGAVSNLSMGTLMLTDSQVVANSSTGTEGGGGLFNAGKATVTRTMFDGNGSVGSGANIMNNGSAADLTLLESTVKGGRGSLNTNGGGLYNGRIATVRRSLFTDNQGNYGGAIQNRGFGLANLSLQNCTISGNLAGTSGGGVHNATENDTVAISDCTIVLNQAGLSGAGFLNEGAATITGSIVSKNTVGVTPSDLNGPVLSGGYNLFGASIGSPHQTDIAGQDPLLDALGNYGGPTQTHRLKFGSPAIDAGNPDNDNFEDQRNYARPKDGNGDGLAQRDIGAFEVQSLVYTAPGPADITIQLNGSNVEIIDNTTSNVVDSVPVDPAGVVSVTGSSGDDSITVDFSNGNPIIGSDFSVNGGTESSGGDRLGLSGTNFDSVTYGLLTAPTGTITLTVSSTTSVMRFNDQERVDDDLSVGQRTYNLRSTGDTGALTDDGVIGNGSSSLALTAAETFDFTAPTTGMTITGGDGNDSLTLSSLDSLFASLLEVRGDNGADTLNATGFTLPLRVLGGNDNDVLTGGAAADYLAGEGGNDTQLGGNGNDTLLGGAGVDSLSGEDGNDLIRGQGSSRDTLTGGLGNDTLDGSQDVLIETGDVNFVLTDTQLTGLGTDVLIGLTEATLNGGASANTINAAAYTGYALLYGREGNDTLIGNNGANFLNGEGGDDSLVGSGGNDNLFGGAGRDTLDGGAGDDRLRGLGGSGDILIGGLGNDTLDGGAGADRVTESGDLNFTVTATQLTGLGTDTLIDVEEVQLTLGAGNNSVNGATAIAALIVSGLGGNDSLIGGAGNDVFNGGDGDDVLKGRNGNDILNGDAGNDTLNGGDGNDTLNGGAGADGLSGYTGNDSLTGGTENDTLYGGVGNDTLKGGDGADVLQGGANVDELRGEAGTDTLTGGTGNGSADVGDAFPDSIAGEINNAFNLNPLPSWIDQI